MMKKITDTPNIIIAPEANKFILVIAMVMVIGFVFSTPLFLLSGAALIFVCYFFRNPARNTPVDENNSLVICPADGKVIEVSQSVDNRYTHNKCQRVCIFMSPFNVHINRSGVSGTVKNIIYQKGKFLAAYDKNASMDNEQSALIVENARGELLTFVQIAGWLARRIKNYAVVGQKLTAGEIYGLIQFGSRVDVYVPINYDIRVNVGDVVVAGETILGKAK